MLLHRAPLSDEHVLWLWRGTIVTDVSSKLGCHFLVVFVVCSTNMPHDGRILQHWCSSNSSVSGSNGSRIDPVGMGCHVLVVSALRSSPLRCFVAIFFCEGGKGFFPTFVTAPSPDFLPVSSSFCIICSSSHMPRRGQLAATCS